MCSTLPIGNVFWPQLESVELSVGDERLRQERFQTGRMLGIYWETVARWMMMRAKHDVVALQTLLFLFQVADHAVPHMPTDIAKKLMNKANPKDTGGMHGILAVHLGMRVRLLNALDRNKVLVKTRMARLCASRRTPWTRMPLTRLWRTAVARCICVMYFSESGCG